MATRQKLELTWVGKDAAEAGATHFAGRLVEELSREASLHEWDILDNRLIVGDNLLSLMALEEEFTRKGKCVFIDPPYKTGSEFELYEGGIEHSPCLGLMRDGYINGRGDRT